MGPTFSPDGARIAYSTGIAGPDSTTMDTWVVPVLGGQPQRLLTNAEGLTWSAKGSGQLRVLFSEMTGRGFQMSIVSSTESRSDQRNVYMPPENGMAHRSRLSPNGDQVIVIEMGFNAWLPCRLVPSDGSSSGKPVGPAPAQCTDAAWSPDGKWMYFSADTGGGVHIWRQRFPGGKPEQITFGVTQEEGIQFSADGRSFVTSIGASQSTLWLHDSRGDRQITSEGYSFWPSISPDGQRVVFTAVEESGRTPVWLASLNGQTAPRRLSTMDSWDAYFGAPGEVVFEGEEKATPFVYRIQEDGSGLQKMIPTPFLVSQGVSPDGRWVPTQDSSAWGALVLYQAGGGSSTRVCAACSVPQGTDPVPQSMKWTPDRKFVYLKFADSTYAIPLRSGQLLPPIPASGFPSKEAVAALPGARLVADGNIYPGPNPSVYAFVKVSTQRNIYRIPVP
jgi:Tol biopolymer transport system component